MNSGFHWREANERIRIAFAGHEIVITVQNVGREWIDLELHIPNQMPLDVDLRVEKSVAPVTTSPFEGFWNTLLGRSPKKPEPILIRHKPDQSLTANATPRIRSSMTDGCIRLSCALNHDEAIHGELPFSGKVLLNKRRPERLELIRLEDCAERLASLDYDYLGHVMKLGESSWAAAKLSQNGRLYRKSNGKMRFVERWNTQAISDEELLGDVVHLQGYYGRHPNSSPIRVFSMNLHSIDLDSAEIWVWSEFGAVECPRSDIA